MKYESSILKRLIDVYGVVGNPRYISEIIKQFIVQGKECYPNLFTYQSDWLAHIDEFGLTPEYTVSYTGQHIYAPNTKEKAVKRAILSGQTLVNLCNLGDVRPNDNTNISTTINNVMHLNPNTKYIIKADITDIVEGSATKGINIDVLMTNTNDNGNIVKTESIINDTSTTKINKILTTTSDTTHFKLIRSYGNATFNNLMIIEYQEGMENWDIPYFEGMKSVQMPVLKTIGKNLFNWEKSTWYMNCSQWSHGNGGLANKNAIGYQGTIGTISDFNLQSDKTYFTNAFISFYADNTLGQALDGRKSKTFIVPNDAQYVAISKEISNEAITKITNPEIILVEGSTPSTYEPHKSNILTTSEEIVLRRIGDVQDTLNCLTGVVTERIGEIVLDGVNYKIVNSTANNDNTKRFDINFTFEKFVGTNNWVDLTKMNASVISDKAVCVFDGYSKHPNKNAIASYNGVLVLFIEDKTILSIEKANEWLQQNPITVQYELKTPIVKTVDLTILDQNNQNVEQLMSFNGGTHFNTGSLEGSPLPSVSVSVETDLEAILKVCSLDGNTM